MSTFVELAQELRQLSGIGGSGPVDVESVSGMEARIVNYVKNAWYDIQAHPKKWKWMWRNYEVDLQPGPGTQPLQTIGNTEAYLLVDTDGNPATTDIQIDTFQSYLTATGISDRQRMTYVPWQQYKRMYGTVQQPSSRPFHVSRRPQDGALMLSPPPDDVYSIEFECFKNIQYLVANADVPEMPARFHQLIVYEGLKRFGKAEDAPEIIKLGEEAAGSDGNEGKPVSGLWRALIWSQEFKDDLTAGENSHMTVICE